MRGWSGMLLSDADLWNGHCWGRELTWFLMIQKRTNHYPCCCVHSKTYMYHNCRQQGFHKETKKQSCVKWQENILHLWIKIHLRSSKLSQRILQISWKIIIFLLLNDLSCEIYLAWKCKVTMPIGWGTCPFTATPPCTHSTLPSKLLVAFIYFMKFLLFLGVNLCRLQKRDCNGMVFIVVASTMVTARGVTNKTCRGKT